MRPSGRRGRDYIRRKERERLQARITPWFEEEALRGRPVIPDVEYCVCGAVDVGGKFRVA